MELKYKDVAGLTKREFKHKIKHHTKRLPRDLAGDVKEFLKEL